MTLLLPQCDRHIRLLLKINYSFNKTCFKTGAHKWYKNTYANLFLFAKGDVSQTKREWPVTSQDHSNGSGL